MAKKLKPNKQKEIAATAANGKPWYREPVYAIIGAMVAACLIIYVQSFWFDFINLDDDQVILNNVAIHDGLTWGSIKWSLTAFYGSNWHPVTWLSHALDIEMFGLTAGGPHAVNVIFHLANSILLYYLVRTLTGRVWESAAVAAIFLVHPAHVESVAWVAERKDALSTLFWILSTFAYVRYARDRGNKRAFNTAIILFATGLAAKPMLVTMPFTLILLDYWPLRRFDKWDTASLLPLFKEKIPFFILSAASAVLTVIVQSAGGAVQSTQTIPLSDRVANVIVSYARYVEMLFYPANLGVWYPFEKGLGLPLVIISAILVVGISVFAIMQVRERKYLFVGWFWFLGTLVPVIGLLQVGRQAMADRYTYVSYIGLSVAVVWLLSEGFKRLKLPKAAVAGLSLAAFAALIVVAFIQVSYWKNTETLSQRTMAVTQNNYLIESNYCNYLEKQNRLDEAVAQCRAAIEHDPTLFEAYNNLGTVQIKQGKIDEARLNFEKTIELKPDYTLAYGNLSKVETMAQNVEKAAEYMAKAIETDRNGFFDQRRRAEAYSAFAITAMRQKQYDLAAKYFKSALEATPENTDFQRNLALSYRMSGRPDLAISLLQDIIQQYPNAAEAYNTLGTIYAEQNKKPEAIAQFQLALKINPEFTPAKNNLKKVMEEGGQQ